MPFLDEGVEVDHLEVVVQKSEDDLAGDARGERADCCEYCSFGHFRLSCESSVMMTQRI